MLALSVAMSELLVHGRAARERRRGEPALSMMDFGWKAKAERLRMVMLSAAHQVAKELPPGFTKVLEVFARLSKAGEMLGLHDEMESIQREHPDEPRPLWEPIEVHGWVIAATLYRKEERLWWLVNARRKNDRDPSDKDLVFLNKVLDHLGGEPTRHAIIGPLTVLVEQGGRLPFGWWTWQNRWPLYDIQLNKDKTRDKDKIRIVPLGTRETDGYTSLSTADLAHGDKEEP